MRLRLILLVLSVQVFCFALVGGYLYYSSLQEAAFNEAEQKAIIRLETIHRNLVSFLSENRKPVQTLSRMTALRRALSRPAPDFLQEADRILDLFHDTLQVDVCYLMDRTGMTLASSNRRDADSFTGENFSFRPYFKDTVNGRAGLYLAVGTTSGKRGAYYSAPVYEASTGKIVGVVVIKASIEWIEKALGFSKDEIGMVVAPSGIIFISNRNDWLFHSLEPLSQQQTAELAASRQFGSGPWPFPDLYLRSKRYAADGGKTSYLVHSRGIAMFPGWKIYHRRNLSVRLSA